MMACNSGYEVKTKRSIWLVGGTSDAITGSKLPSNQQVLSRFFHLHISERQSLQVSAKSTTNEVLSFWEKARIPTRKDYHIINKIKDMYSIWQGLKKNVSRKTDTQKNKVDAFVDTLGDLFDVAHSDALAMIKIAEDKEFLLAQRERGRRGCMGSVDTKLAKQEDLCLQKSLVMESRKRKEADRSLNESKIVMLSGSSSEENEDTSDDEDVQLSMPTVSRKIKLSNIITPGLAAALDRTKISDRNATYVLAATAKSLGHDPSAIVLNKESIRQARRFHRKTIAADIQASFSPDIPLTVHWDGKLLPALLSKNIVDRLAIVVSGQGVMKLLGVPKLPCGTGEAQAAAVFTTIEEWNLTNRIQFMSFDTTASNTGLKNGACVLIEQKIKRDLVSLACRHHIHELILAKVFDTLLKHSSGPVIKLFQRFSASWTSIDKGKHASGMEDEWVASIFNPLKNDLVTFIHLQLTDFQHRDDYRELLQLALLFLGAAPDKDVHIMTPGAYHRARWMAKLIYCLKIYLFRFQFHLTTRELHSLRQYNTFVVKVYLKAWYTCQCAASAPQNDLKLVKELVSYEAINEHVSKAALKVFSGQLWYLSETLIGLAFFDPLVNIEMKTSMVAALEKTGQHRPPRRVQLDPKYLVEKEISDLMTVNTKRLFEALEISQDFLRYDTNTWEANNDYKKAQLTVNNLKVVNDAAERGVALIQSFNAILTNQEEQKQFLLQVVEKHRQDFPVARKSAIIEQINKQ